jgi:hypothetical protein
MPQKEIKTKGCKTHPMVLLPITTTLLVKKTTHVKPDPNSLDFHLDIIKKLDKILAEHQQETTPIELFPTPPLNPPSPPTPIEPRPPLNKAFPHQEIAWELVSESPRVMKPVMPEEFKTEISFNPEFRFISGHEFIETTPQTQLSPDDRVEIIDFNTLIRDDSGYHKTPDLTPLKNPRNEKETSPFKHILFDEDGHHNKIEIIDTRTLKQKTYEHVLHASEDQAVQIDKKAQMYFLNSKDSTPKKQQRLDLDQTAIPDDVDEQSKELKKKLAEEEKKLKQLELEYERLEKMEKKKTTHPDKKQLSTEKEKTPLKKEQQTAKSKRALKSQQKEQKRLKRLQIRQARIEERRRKKLEKQALKLKQKQQHLKMKGSKQQKTVKTGTLKGDTNTPILLFDEDLIKVLHMTDSLLGELPEDILTDFIESKDYKLYEKVMNKYKIK